MMPFAKCGSTRQAIISARDKNWKKFKEKMKDLSQRKNGKMETIVVQRLTAVLSTLKSEHVSLLKSLTKLSVDNVKKACRKHYGMFGNNVLQCTCRGTRTILFLYTTVANLESNSHVIY